MNRKFKYGASAVLFTAIFVAFILILNAVLSAIASNMGGMYLDITSKKIYTISDASRSALKDVKGQVEIIFCSDADLIEADEHMRPIKRLAENYSAEFSNIKVSYHNSVNDPTYFYKYQTNKAEAINSSSVIIHCPDNNTSVICQGPNFYRYTTEGAFFAFDGENVFTTAILSTARPIQLKAGFVTGHGETRPAQLEKFLSRNGYEVTQPVDLKTISNDELSTYDLLVICTPAYDFTGREAAKDGNVNEISKLNTYLTGSFKNLMVFLNPESPELPELQEFLSEDWGVNYLSGKIVTDGSDNTVAGAHSYNILGNISNDTGLTSSLNTSSAKPLFTYSVPLVTTFTQKNTKTVKTVVHTSSEATVWSNQESSKMPYIPLLTVTDHYQRINQVDKHAYVMVCSSRDFLSVLGSNQESQFSNTDVIKSVLKKMGNTNVVTDIEFKLLDEDTISVTENDYDNVWKLLVIPVPVIIGIAGLVVYFKRKHS